MLEAGQIVAVCPGGLWEQVRVQGGVGGGGGGGRGGGVKKNFCVSFQFCVSRLNPSISQSCQHFISQFYRHHPRHHPHSKAHTDHLQEKLFAQRKRGFLRLAIEADVPIFPM